MPFCLKSPYNPQLPSEHMQSPYSGHRVLHDCVLVTSLSTSPAPCLLAGPQHPRMRLCLGSWHTVLFPRPGAFRPASSQGYCLLSFRSHLPQKGPPDSTLPVTALPSPHSLEHTLKLSSLFVCFLLIIHHPHEDYYLLKTQQGRGLSGSLPCHLHQRQGLAPSSAQKPLPHESL